ncbi:heterodisulfide reductase subunit C [Candidatus Woesearchaeota archaeon CG11_big_fil_rev_8_21_14_0_20_43_8]|nr:MAG: heterodisulfide reductase subunit C [Candidatus Woesearchaeota archaeon CG11_big_fil_rev_8_21_14_0_20_43_8]PIO09015.1 MAG: heterodisulfide reductase subunit C [Candidatus Woesearchaeota archaeon CG08_land_8_20_14_0_20_43_7]
MEKVLGKNRKSEIKEIEGFIDGLDVSGCYQCGKCTAGCPVAHLMDNPPQRMIRLVQIGAIDEALSSNAYWNCVACGTCSARCPRKVKISELMDGLKSFSIKKKMTPKDRSERNIALFNEIFLNNIRRHGRLFEVELVGMNNVLSGHLLRDTTKAPEMLVHGKLKFIPSNIAKKDMKKIFKNTVEKNDKR